MYKNGFDINDQQWLMCHKTKPNETISQARTHTYICARAGVGAVSVTWFGHEGTIHVVCLGQK